MKRWWLIPIICFIGLLAVFFRYDVTPLNTTSGPVAYMVDRWTGNAWYLRENLKIPVGAPSPEPEPQPSTPSKSPYDNEKYVKPSALNVIANEDVICKALGSKFIAPDFDWLSRDQMAKVLAYTLYWGAITPDDLTPEGLDLLTEYNFDTNGRLNLNKKFPWEAEKIEEWEAILRKK